MASLQDKTLSGVFWSMLQRLGSQGVTFFVTILLSRLLVPQDFGLIGMLMIFIHVSQAIVDGGFNLALIQKKHVDEVDYSSVFYVNLIVGCTLYIVLFSLAPVIADFYQQPQLIELTRALSLVFVINAFSLIQEVRLTKDLYFKKLTLVNIPSTLCGGIVSLILGFTGFGVWSIVAMHIVTRLMFAIQIWIYSNWRPKICLNLKSVKQLFSFGSNLLVARVIGVLYDNIYLVLIGKFFPLSSVGYYQNAYTFAIIPSMTISTVLSKVTFPVFSLVQDDNERLKRGYKRVMQQAFFWICPLYVLAGTLAPVIFEVVFTDKWLPAVPYFRWLCIVAVFQPLYNYNLNIVTVKGRSDLFLKLQLIRRGITTIAIVATLPHGIFALIAVQSTSAVFTFLIFSYFSGRFILYNAKEQIKDLLPILLVSVLMGVVVLFFDSLLIYQSNIIRLLVGFVLGGGIFIAMAYWCNFPSFVDFQKLFLEKVGNRIFTRS